ncbi:hypothetical protein KQI77_07495 [Clostridium sp. MSJ-8]|uniref:phage baseplate assembly protein V n=1 Tax=Clostridium sp. MSJ-8 TaxID=2841510 RepID=UPI001C0EB33E|nr:phage baseplate assembly protein V [Clostridium sp. MSJ-8]MBU5488009.1 hypothetical protein [Clostridium sp. MSJ-8]
MKKDTIIYENLRLSVLGIKHIEEIQIENIVNKHSIMKVKAILDDKVKDMYFHFTQEQTSIMAYYEKGEKDAEVIFSGVITKAKVKSFDNIYTLELEAKSNSYYMDIYKVKKTFQDVGMTSHELIREVMNKYSFLNYKINIPNEPIGEFILQYEETDYEFLKRFLSRYNEMMYILPSGDKYCIYFGVPDSKVNMTEEINNYSVTKKINEYNYAVKNDNSKVSMIDYITYKIKLRTWLDLGESFNFKGNRFYIAEAIHKLEDGVIVNEYYIRAKDGLRHNRIYNDKVIGISLFGTIAEVKRDRVKVNLEIEEVQDKSKLYWFPYASVAASPDGGGWYCMPEVGERVRLNIPSKDEKKAFVINSIDSHQASDGNSMQADRMSTPENKSLQTDAGQEVKFTPSGVSIASTDGASNMNLNNDGTVTIIGKTEVKISCANTLAIRAEKEVNIKAKDTIDINCESGSKLAINKSDNIVARGERILNNG